MARAKFIVGKPLSSGAVLKGWVGLKCSEILHQESDWSFEFDGGGGLSIECPWRIIASDRIAYADEDDGQKFGLPEPINGAETAMRLLSGKKIVSVEVSPVSGDLRVEFVGDTFLEIFNNSSGYEGWNGWVRGSAKHTHVVAQGGGQLSIWEK